MTKRKAASKKLKRNKSLGKVKSLRIPGSIKLNPQPLPP